MSGADGDQLSGFWLHKKLLSLDGLNIWRLQVPQQSRTWGIWVGVTPGRFSEPVTHFLTRICFLFRVPTVPVKNLNGSSPVHPALAGKGHFDSP